MKVFKIIIALTLFAFTIFVYQGCKQLAQFTQAINNLKRCQFKLENVSNYRLSGINLSNKKSLSDFSLTDGLSLTRSFATKSFPSDFVLNVSARNPNDGKGGTPQTTATLSRLDWRLLIDDAQTVSGDIDKTFEIPGTGQSTNIPLNVSLDLYQFFGNQGYDKVVNLALALGGLNKNPARLKLDIHPTISTPLGNIEYPGRITVVDKEYK